MPGPIQSSVLPRWPATPGMGEVPQGAGMPSSGASPAPLPSSAFRAAGVPAVVIAGGAGSQASTAPATGTGAAPSGTMSVLAQDLATAFDALARATKAFLQALFAPLRPQNAAQAIPDPAPAAPAANAPAPAPISPSPAAVGSPDSFFYTQFSSNWNPDGPSTSANCGPTSLAMAIKAFGKMPAGMQPEVFIEQVRQRMTGADDIETGTTNQQIAQGAASYGLSTTPVSSMSDVDAALAKGQMVVANGNPIGYEHDHHMTGADYGNGARFSGHHFILVVAKNTDGSYTINDPMSRKGSITVSGQDLANYFSDGGHWGGVAVGP